MLSEGEREREKGGKNTPEFFISPQHKMFTKKKKKREREPWHQRQRLCDFHQQRAQLGRRRGDNSSFSFFFFSFRLDTWLFVCVTLVDYISFIMSGPLLGLPSWGQDAGVTINTIRPGQIPSVGQIDERCKHHNNLQSALITTLTRRRGGTGFLQGVETQDSRRCAHAHTHTPMPVQNLIFRSLLCESGRFCWTILRMHSRCAVNDKEAIHKCIFIRLEEKNMWIHLKIHCTWMKVPTFPYCVDNARSGEWRKKKKSMKSMAWKGSENILEGIKKRKRKIDWLSGRPDKAVWYLQGDWIVPAGILSKQPWFFGEMTLI